METKKKKILIIIAIIAALLLAAVIIILVIAPWRDKNKTESVSGEISETDDDSSGSKDEYTFVVSDVTVEEKEDGSVILILTGDSGEEETLRFEDKEAYDTFVSENELPEKGDTVTVVEESEKGYTIKIQKDDETVVTVRTSSEEGVSKTVTSAETSTGKETTTTAEKSSTEKSSSTEKDETSDDESEADSGEGKTDPESDNTKKETTKTADNTPSSTKAPETTTTAAPTQPTTQPTAAPTTAPTVAPTPPPTQPPTQPTQPPETQHQHAWEKYVISEAYDEVVVVTPAWDEEIVIPAQEIQVPVTEQHSVCNACGADLNALVAQAEAEGFTTAMDYHRAIAGHDSWHEEWWPTGQYTTQVIPEQRITEHHDAVTQTVHHDAVYGERCSGCGTTR